MDTRNEEFLKRINETFRIEAEEHLSAFSAGLSDLLKKQSREKHAEIIETLFREIHSLKGAARSVDQRDIESVCHPLESVFSTLKNNDLKIAPATFDLFYRALDRLTNLIINCGIEQSVTDRQLQRELIRQLKDFSTLNSDIVGLEQPKNDEEPESLNPGPKNKNVPHITTDPESETLISMAAPSAENQGSKVFSQKASPILADTVRIKISKLDPLLLQAEEFIQSKKAINQRINDLRKINESMSEWISESLNQKGYQHFESSSLRDEALEGNVAFINKLESQITDLSMSMERDKYSLDRLVDNHLEAMRQVLMLPISSIVAALPGMVRQIAQDQKKEIDFVINGEELEIDKRILEELKDPIIHMIRNSIDHGIDRPQDRILHNKPPQGTITLSFIAREGGLIEILLSDDGNGVNPEQLLKAAIKSGSITREFAEKLNPGEILSLIYQSGVSTSPIITDISGRGLGLSIVHEKVDKLNGRISVTTDVNSGTTFCIVIPMTLATFRGILIRINEFMCILPTIYVERVMRVGGEEISTIENREIIRLGELIIPVADMGEVLGLAEQKHSDNSKKELKADGSAQITLVVLVSGKNRIAFRVDEVIDEQQVLVKGLGKLLKRVRNITGTTILGSGKMAPVLHVPDLIKSSLRFTRKTKSEFSYEQTDGRVKKILVADDSVTSRTLIKNILETAGYLVVTAVDGMDAFTLARSNEFDLIVSDVDMPRLNGFELITRIRHDKKLSELPAVLVTALGSREDHERGIEAGADAYIIKSNFDQTNLLEIIKRLI